MTSDDAAPVADPDPAGHAYVARTNWPAGVALAATVFIFLCAVSVSSFATLSAMGLLKTNTGPSGAPTESGLLVVGIILRQAIIIVLTWLFAGFFRTQRTAMLALHAPAGGWRDVAKAFAGMIVVVTIVNLVGKLFAPGDFERDMAPFVQLAKSDTWWITLIAVGIGAPLSEEFLFRGFLFGPLSLSRIGPKGAALVTSAGWTALHAGYSAVGVIEVGLIGLYFAYVLWRTGSLWVPILCHGIYNSALFAFIMVAPPPGGS